MNIKRSLESRIRGWGPREPRLPKTLPQINLQPLQAESFLNRHRLTLGLVGGVLTILVAIGAFFVGLIFTDVLRGYGIYASGELEPMLRAMQSFVLGGVGLAVGVLGIVGSRIGKRFGGILLIIAGVATLVLFFFFGILPAILMIISGATELGKNQSEPPKAREPVIRSFPKTILLKNIALFASAVGVVALLTSAIVRFKDSTFLFGFDLRLIFIFVLIGWAIFWFRRRRALNDWYSILLFASALAMVGWAGYLLWFQIIDFIGYLVLSIVDISIFSLLYAWAQRTAQQKRICWRKILGMLLTIMGIMILSSSLAFTTNVEYKHANEDFSEVIFSNSFKLIEPVPDIEVAANLTTQDQVTFGVVVSAKGDVDRPNIDLTISDQPEVSNQTAKVFFQEFNINNNFFKRWDVPQNGTYYFKLHYNFIAEGYASTSITKHWSANELVPTQVNTPILAEYASPTLILGMTFLVGASSIPVSRKFR